jgi:hypothetical protein
LLVEGLFSPGTVNGKSHGAVRDLASCDISQSQMNPAALSNLAAIVSAFAAVFAIAVTWLVYRGQSALTKAQSKLSKEIHDQQVLLSQRQLLIPLWEYMSKLHRIDRDNPVKSDVLMVVNTLELVALCTEGGMVDSQVIRRTFQDVYLELYDQVNACQTIRTLPDPVLIC